MMDAGAIVARLDFLLPLSEEDVEMARRAHIAGATDACILRALLRIERQLDRLCAALERPQAPEPSADTAVPPEPTAPPSEPVVPAKRRR